MTKRIWQWVTRGNNHLVQVWYGDEKPKWSRDFQDWYIDSLADPVLMGVDEFKNLFGETIEKRTVQKVLT